MERARFLTSTACALAVAPALATKAYAKPVTLTIGIVDSFSSADATAAAQHEQGANVAIAELNKRGGVQYAKPVRGDDRGTPSDASNEVERLAIREKVDLIFGGTSSACALARSTKAAELNVFDLQLGAGDPRITGAKAQRSTYRFAPNWQMEADAVARYVASLKKRTYVLYRDDAFGAQAYATVSAALPAGTVTGHAALALTVAADGTSRPLLDPSAAAALSAVRASQAELLVLAVHSTDIRNLIAAINQWAPDHHVEVAALCRLPSDATAVKDMIFPVIWNPDATAAARALASKLRAAVNGDVTADHYLGYAAMMNLGDILARARTTDTAKLVAAFDQSPPFEAAKTTKSFWQKCDHQCAQDVYVGRWYKPLSGPAAYKIVSALAANGSDSCQSSSARAATAALGGQQITPRGDYKPQTW